MVGLFDFEYQLRRSKIIIELLNVWFFKLRRSDIIQSIQMVLIFLWMDLSVFNDFYFFFGQVVKLIEWLVYVIFNFEYQLRRSKIIFAFLLPKIQHVNKFGCMCLAFCIYFAPTELGVYCYLIFIMILPLWGFIYFPSIIFISSSVKS